MTTEQAKSFSENALTRLAEALEQGRSEALTAYLSVMSRFHRYSWGNSLMIYGQNPDATHVAGFHAWRRLGRFVRKGEKGIVILAPMVHRRKTETAFTEDEQARLFGFRAAHVFDISQTDGEPLPEFTRVQGDPQFYTGRLVEFVASRAIALEYSDTISPAWGMSHGGKITLRPGMEPAEAFAVLAHEMAHELLHKKERRAQTTHVIRETEAEAVAFVVCSGIGLDANTASRDYIQLHAGGKETLAESLAIIQETSALILQALRPDSETAS